MGLLIRVLLILLLPSFAFAADLTPDIAVLPSTTVAVGQEVVFNAEGTTYAPDQTLVRRGRYEWNFGDDYVFQNPMSEPYTTIRPNAMSVSHYFMKPGTFTVTLTVKIWSVFSDTKDTYPCVAAGCSSGVGLDVTPDATGTTTVEITVAGKEPLTGFEIEHAPFYNRSKQYVYVQVPATYRSSSYTLKVYTIDTTAEPDVSTELLSKNNPGSEESVLLDHTVLTAGHAYTLRAQILDGEGAQVVDGSKEGIFEAFFTTPATTPITTIDENNTFSFNGSKVFPLYTFMTHSTEPEITQWSRIANSWHTFNTQGTSTAYATYIDAYYAVNPDIMAIGPGRGKYQEDGEGTVYPPRNKRNHILSGITEYATAAKAKTSLFMVAIQDEPNMGASWEKALTPTLAAWQYTSNSADPDHPTQVGFMGQEWLQNLAASYNDYQGSSYLFGGRKWAPTTMGYDVFAASAAARFHGGTTSCNRTDMGPWWAYLAGKDRMRSFNARTSKSTSTDYKDYREIMPMTGAVKPCANGVQKNITSDSHTIGTGSHSFTVGTYQNFKAGQYVSIGSTSSISSLLTHRMFGTVTSYNYLTGALVVDVTSTEGSGTYTGWQVTVEYPAHIDGETTYQAWIEVAHGAKGLLWFQYFDRPSMQMSEMETFKRQITALWPYISGPVPSTTVTDDKDDKLARVDTMIRESGEDKYIVAVRVTEPPPEPAIAWVRLTGTPSTVIADGKVRDTNNIVWSLPSSVTIGEDGSATVMATCDTSGDVTYVPFGMTTIETPTEGWTSVENAYGNRVDLTETSFTIPSSYPSSSTYTINIGAGLDWPANSDDLTKGYDPYRIRLGRNDSAATRLTHYMYGNYVSYNSGTGVLTFIMTSYGQSGTYTNWRCDIEWYNQVVGATRYTGEEPSSIDATFTISGLSGNTTIDVIDESRQLTAVDGVFTDSFAKNAVHLYTIGGITSTTDASGDVTAPAVSAFTLPATSDSLTVSISSFTCTDAVGVTGYCATTANSSSGCVWSGTAPATLTFDTEGEKTGYGWCKDAADNISSAVSDTVTIDTTAIYRATISTNGTGTGTVTSDVGSISCGDVCFDDYDDSTVVTLTASADDGSVFAGWSGSGCSGTSTCQITMSEARSVIATFNKDQYVVYITYPSDGTAITDSSAGVDCGDDSVICEYVLNAGSSLYLTATCDGGYYSPVFSGSCTTSNTCTIAVDDTLYISASCTKNCSHTIGTGSGHVLGSGSAITIY